MAGGRPKPQRRRYDPQPTAPAAVLLASPGSPFSNAAVDRAVELSQGGPVAVLSIARIYGYAFGLPNPGLMPTRREREAQLDIVERAIRRLQRQGLEADGQVAASRSAARTIARVAKARQVHHVVIDTPEVPRWRRVVEGDLGRAIRWRLGAAAMVEAVGRPGAAAGQEGG